MVAVLATTLVVGAAVQGLVGLGLGLLAAPMAMLLQPQLMPDLVLWLIMVFPLVTLAREHQEIDWRGLRWSLGARIPGTAAGVAIVTAVSVDVLGVVVGLIVLVSVLLTWRAVVIPVNRGTLVAAGLTSGITGTATSIGGPPLAILLQHRTPRQIRTTLAVYFMVGGALSLVGLYLTGRGEPHALLVALALLPFLAVGLLVARALRGSVPREQVRLAMLAVCTLSAVVLIARSIS